MKLCLYTKKYRANPNRCPDFQDLTPPGSPDVLDWCPLTPHYYLTQSTENGAFRARAGLVGLLHRFEFFLRRCGHPKRMKDVLSSSKSQCIPFPHPGGGGEIGVSKNPRRPNFLAQYADAYKVSWTPNTNRRNIGWVNFVFNTAIPLSNRSPYKQHSPIPWCPLTVSQCFLSREVKVFFFPFHWSTCLFTWMKPLECTYDVRGLWRHNYVDSNFQGWCVDSQYR